MAATHYRVELTHRGRVLGLIAAVAAAAAWLAEDADARLAAALLAAPLLVDFVLKQRGLHLVEIAVAKRFTTAGAPYSERLELTSRSQRPLRECLLFEPRTMRVEAPVLVPRLAPGEPLRIVLRQRSSLRSHTLERVFALTSTWPLGLLRTRAAVVVRAELVTAPAPVPLHAEVERALHDQESQRRSPRRHEGEEFHSLREHQPDEDARRVHALRSAAAGTLVRRVLRGSLPRTAGIVLDLRRPPGRRLDQGVRRFEWSLGSCVSLVRLLRDHDVEVAVAVLDAEPTALRVRTTGELQDLLTLLAEASPTQHRPASDEAFALLKDAEHRFWIPAGSYYAAPEFAAMSGRITLVGGEDE
ncbi:MAG: hypothetical protein RL398_1213 [Planctomycetota bacterium]|jgi:uncharacterized protein (DUF58 family)